MFTTHSLFTVQRYLKGIYSDQNEHLAPIVMTTLMTKKMSDLLKHVFDCIDLRSRLAMPRYNEGDLKGLYDICQTQTVQVFSWLAGLANHSSIIVSLENEVRSHFPGVCPYCFNGICICNPRPKERFSKADLKLATSRLPDGINLQLMLHNIYPKNSLRKSIVHLNCECSEVAQVIACLTAKYSTTRLIQTQSEFGEEGRFAVEELRMEIADMMAHLFAVAGLLDFCLLEETMVMFANGCPLCSCRICQCDLLGLEMAKVGTRPMKESM